MDRFSELPQDIVHHIYSFLSIKDVVKTSLLSNLWHSNFLSYPTLDFDLSLFLSRDLDFSKHVNHSLLRLHKHNLDIKKFRLKLCYHHRESLTIPQNVKDVVGFCKNIRVFELCNCALTKEGFNFPCLNKLSLERVKLDEFKLKKLLESCPEVSDFSYDQCVGLRSLSISGITKLKTLKVALMPIYGVIAIRVAIDVPTLENLHINGSYCGDVKLVNGKNLKSVVFEYGKVFNNDFLEDLVSKSPVLERLILNYLSNLNRLNIASHHLRILTIGSCQNLRDCKIDALNLHTFRYRGCSPQDICFVSDIQCWWRIEFDLLDELYQFSDLKQFL